MIYPIKSIEPWFKCLIGLVYSPIFKILF